MKKILTVLSVLFFLTMMILRPDICRQGAAEGIILCGRVIIPSLFPFTVCVLFLVRANAFRSLRFLNPLTKRVFHLSPDLFSLMLLSLTGGYPIGAKLLSEAVSLGKISQKNAGIMLSYCVNAGPAFVILAIGTGIFSSKTIGYILLAAHVSASLLLAYGFGFFLEEEPPKKKTEQKEYPPSENFVLSVSGASSSVLSICGYVILFSTLLSYLNTLPQTVSGLRTLSLFLEVTNAVGQTENLIFISFLLGFGGLCVWCQIYAVGHEIKIHFLVFAVSRILHGLLGAGFTYLLIRLFPVAVPTLSGTRNTVFAFSSSTPAVSVSLLCMSLVLILSLYTKKSTGKLSQDLI